MKFENPYEGIVERASSIQRWIIVQSIIYYELNGNIVSDRVFDDNAKQLVELQKELKRKGIFEFTRYSYCFGEFDGTTGFDLYGLLNDKDKEYLEHIARSLVWRFGK